MKTVGDQTIERSNILNFDNILSQLKYFSISFNKYLTGLASIFIMLMMLVVVINAVVRLFYVPFMGTTEVVGWLAAAAITFSLGYTHANKGFVEIDFLAERLPSNIQKILKIIISLVCTIFFALISWQMVLYGQGIAENGNLSETMSIPFYPIIYIVALGFANITLSFFVDFLYSIRKITKS